MRLIYGGSKADPHENYMAVSIRRGVLFLGPYVRDFIILDPCSVALFFWKLRCTFIEGLMVLIFAGV